MITKLTITQQYSKYIDTIKSCNNGQLIENYKRFVEWLNKECKDEELHLLLLTNCVYMTLKEVRDRKIFLRDTAEEWPTIEVQKFHKILDSTLSRREMLIKGGDCKQEYTACEGNLIKHIVSQKDPSVQLYMYLKHENSADGRNLYKADAIRVVKLLEAVSEEEIDKILQGEEA